MTSACFVVDGPVVTEDISTALMVYLPGKVVDGGARVVQFDSASGMCHTGMYILHANGTSARKTEENLITVLRILVWFADDVTPVGHIDEESYKDEE